MENRVGIIGHFGGKNKFLDGQTVKTKVLYEELQRKGFDDIYCVDTYYNKKNKIKLFYKTVQCIIKCDIIILLVSNNGLKVYLPILYYVKKFLKRKVFHDVIGGNLANHIDRYPRYGRYLNSFDGNWVEFGRLKKELEERGVNNGYIVPNFKRLNTEMAKIDIDEEAQYKLCMFSRIMKEKGVTDAIEAVHKFNGCHNKKIFLEIWGPIDKGYELEFNNLLEKYPNDFCYKGEVDYTGSVEVLTEHLALLFPTHFDVEGVPGTVIDAYAAGIPVIARSWNASSEIIRNFKTGIVYPNSEMEDLYQSIDWAYKNLDKMKSMREKCIKCARDYSSDVVIEKIIKYLYL